MAHYREVTILLTIFGYLTTTNGFLEFLNFDLVRDLQPEDGGGGENFNTLATPSLLSDNTDDETCQRDNEAAGFKLYTRYSRNEGECIQLDTRPSPASFFNSSRKTMLFIHGYMGSGDDWYVNDLKNSLIDKYNVNFIAVDWSVGSWQLPMFAMFETSSVASSVSEFLRNVTSLYGIPLRKIHVIGHSLGARVAGKVGEELRGKLGRITVLDPVPADYRGAARFVDVIHATFLSDWATGDVQFFPNNGRVTGVIPWSSAHIKSVYLYQQSVLGNCEFKAYECENYQQYINHECDSNEYNFLGHHASGRLARGKLYLTITDDAPFCDVSNDKKTSSKT